MKTWIITFGQGHRLKDETPMKDHWVTVESPNATLALRAFQEEFTKPHMGSLYLPLQASVNQMSSLRTSGTDTFP